MRNARPLVPLVLLSLLATTPPVSRSPSTTGSWCTTPTTSISPLPSRLSSCRPSVPATMAPSSSLIKSLPCDCSFIMILHRCNPQPPQKCISPFTIKTFKQPNPFHPRQCFTSSHLDSLIKKENQKQTCLLSKITKICW